MDSCLNLFLDQNVPNGFIYLPICEFNLSYVSNIQFNGSNNAANIII